MSEQEMVWAANWLRQSMHHDPDVRAGFYAAVGRRGYENMDEFVEADPDGFIEVVAALREMTEQIPVEQTRSAGRGKRAQA